MYFLTNENPYGRTLSLRRHTNLNLVHHCKTIYLWGTKKKYPKMFIFIVKYKAKGAFILWLQNYQH